MRVASNVNGVAVSANIYRVTVGTNINGVAMIAITASPISGAMVVIVRTYNVIAIPCRTWPAHATLVRMITAL